MQDFIMQSHVDKITVEEVTQSLCLLDSQLPSWSVITIGDIDS